MVYPRYQFVRFAHIPHTYATCHTSSNHSPFSALNLSQLSLSVENTVAAIMRASTLASCASCRREESKSAHLPSLQSGACTSRW